MIKHALTREVAYGSLLKAKRAPLHAGFAEWLERNAKDEDERAPLLAHHYTEAVLPEDLDVAWPGREKHAEALRVKAVLWSRRAADLAIARYEIDEGLALLRRAVSLEPEPGGRLRSGSGSARRVPSNTMAKASGRPCGKRWTSVAPRPRCTRTSPWKPISGPGCGSSSRT